MSGTASVIGDKPDSAPKMETQASENTTTTSSADEQNLFGPSTPYLSSNPGSPYLLSRNSSFIGRESLYDDFGDTPPDKITFFDLFENLSLPMRLEKWQAALNSQKEKVKKQQERLRTTGNHAKDRAVAEWKKRAPTSEEQLARYRRRVKKSVDDLNKRWSDTMTITAKEKISFVSAVLNIFVSGYLIGATPEYFYYWFTAQFAYFMPIRYITYRRKGYHYFVADLCYFVNALCIFTIWMFPKSKRLFISTYCLAYGNNAVAIVMWRNSLVFHSLDKVTSLFIHVMPPVTLHCMVHLTSAEFLKERFPAVYSIKYSAPGSKEHYSLYAMLLWATLPYAVWQISYHFFITVARADKIAAGRPTSFTWLRKSYAKSFLGKFVLALPDSLQEVAFMLIQYSYALLTIIPCPFWFWYRWASAGFLLLVFSWSVWNGANYYMDVFGTRFKKELEQMKADVAKWQTSPYGSMSPLMGANTPGIQTPFHEKTDYLDAGVTSGGKTPGQLLGMRNGEKSGHEKQNSVDKIPMLDDDSNAAGKEKEKANSRATGAQIMNDADTEGLAERRS